MSLNFKNNQTDKKALQAEKKVSFQAKQRTKKLEKSEKSKKVKKKKSRIGTNATHVGEKKIG